MTDIKDLELYDDAISLVANHFVNDGAIPNEDVIDAITVFSSEYMVTPRPQETMTEDVAMSILGRMVFRGMPSARPTSTDLQENYDSARRVIAAVEYFWTHPLNEDQEAKIDAMRDDLVKSGIQNGHQARVIAEQMVLRGGWVQA